MTFGLREDENGFYLVLPADFNNIPGLDRAVLFAAVGDMMREFRDAGIPAFVEASPVL